MAKYMIFGKYAPAAAAAVNQAGMVSRRKVMQDYVEGLGGTLIDAYAIAAPTDYDFVFIMEHDSLDAGKLVAHNLSSIGSGGFAQGMNLVLASFEEVDAAIKTMPGYTPPGQ